ncbi:LCP family protein [Massilistercora timonensis]|uniref:LCP family protein n=1 Tax=Massilistercora timonensis TaxID=2086584 RepID=UPI003207D2F6
MARGRRRHHRGRRKPGNWFTRLSIGKRIAVCMGGLILALGITGVAYAASKLNKLDTEEIPAEDIVVNKQAEEAGEGYTNVALFGIDSRSGELEIGTRSDCIIVASLNNKTKEIRMVSVYRDTILDIKDGQLQKCNAAYSFGGPTQAINMLNKNLDLDIQDYATVDFAAIANAIDLLGGIEIDLKPEEIAPLNKFVKETARVAGKKAHTVSEAGLQQLDGVQATTYARIRSTAGGDFTRTERQRLVIEKIAEKAQQSDLATINKIIDELFPTIKTSFTATEILSYAKDFMKYKIGDSSGFPFDKTTATISGLGSIVIPVDLESNVQELHKFLYDKEGYQPSSEVQAISGAIVSRVGQREATDDSTLNSQTYTPTAEDRAQEQNQYTPSGNGGGNGSGNGSQTPGTGNEGSGGSGDSGSGSGGSGGSSGSGGNGGSSGGNEGSSGGNEGSSGGNEGGSGGNEGGTGESGSGESGGSGSGGNTGEGTGDGTATE